MDISLLNTLRLGKDEDSFAGKWTSWVTFGREVGEIQQRYAPVDGAGDS
jgi:hypothetical protein